MGAIKPIETIYKGYRMRSRLEARWAVFFDELGIKWKYEYQGYGNRRLQYLPDFWLPEYEFYVEIKPDDPSDEAYEKARSVGAIILAGDVWPHEYVVHDPDYNRAINHIAECMFCGAIMFAPSTHLADHYYRDPGCPIVGPYSDMSDSREYGLIGLHEQDTPRLMAAYTAARQARFEHGERGIR